MNVFSVLLIAANLAAGSALSFSVEDRTGNARADGASLIFTAQEPSAANTKPAPQAYVDTLNQAVTLANLGLCKRALEIMIPAVNDLAYADLLDESKDLLQTRIANCALKQQRWLDALDAVNQLLDIRGDEPGLLKLKFDLGMITERSIDSLSAVERLAETTPQIVRTIELRAIFRLLNRLDKTLLGDLRLRFLDALWRANYMPPDPVKSMDGLRMAYARLLRDNAMPARAADVIAEVIDPVYLAETLFDDRYEQMRSFAGMPTLEGMPAAAAHYLEEKEIMTRTQPKSLAATLDYIQALRLVGQFEDAEFYAASVAARMGDSADASPYTDYDESARWVLNEWGYTLYDLGRNDEARAVMKKAASLDETGGANVSQLINASSLLVSEGRFDEALAEIAKLDPESASPYGIMWAKSVIVCARTFLDQQDHAVPDLRYMKEHSTDNLSALMRALLCADDIPAAAALYVKRLDDPEDRLDALQALQLTLEPPHRLPVDAELKSRFNIVRDDPDVRAATSTVGKILSLPIYPVYWGDI